jgi:hypothetical protein
MRRLAFKVVTEAGEGGEKFAKTLPMLFSKEHSDAIDVINGARQILNREAPLTGQAVEHDFMRSMAEKIGITPQMGLARGYAVSQRRTGVLWATSDLATRYLSRVSKAERDAIMQHAIESPEFAKHLLAQINLDPTGDKKIRRLYTTLFNIGVGALDDRAEQTPETAQSPQ